MKQGNGRCENHFGCPPILTFYNQHYFNRGRETFLPNSMEKMFCKETNYMKGRNKECLNIGTNHVCQCGTNSFHHDAIHQLQDYSATMPVVSKSDIDKLKSVYSRLVKQVDNLNISKRNINNAINNHVKYLNSLLEQYDQTGNIDVLRKFVHGINSLWMQYKSEKRQKKKLSSHCNKKKNVSTSTDNRPVLTEQPRTRYQKVNDISRKHKVLEKTIKADRTIEELGLPKTEPREPKVINNPVGSQQLDNSRNEQISEIRDELEKAISMINSVESKCLASNKIYLLPIIRKDKPNREKCKRNSNGNSTSELSSSNEEQNIERAKITRSQPKKGGHNVEIEKSIHKREREKSLDLISSDPEDKTANKWNNMKCVDETESRTEMSTSDFCQSEHVCPTKHNAAFKTKLNIARREKVNEVVYRDIETLEEDLSTEGEIKDEQAWKRREKIISHPFQITSSEIRTFRDEEHPLNTAYTFNNKMKNDSSKPVVEKLPSQVSQVKNRGNAFASKDKETRAVRENSPLLQFCEKRVNNNIVDNTIKYEERPLEYSSSEFNSDATLPPVPLTSPFNNSPVISTRPKFKIGNSRSNNNDHFQGSTYFKYTNNAETHSVNLQVLGKRGHEARRTIDRIPSKQKCNHIGFISRFCSHHVHHDESSVASDETKLDLLNLSTLPTNSRSHCKQTCPKHGNKKEVDNFKVIQGSLGKGKTCDISVQTSTLELIDKYDRLMQTEDKPVVNQQSQTAIQKPPKRLTPSGVFLLIDIKGGKTEGQVHNKIVKHFNAIRMQVPQLRRNVYRVAKKVKFIDNITGVRKMCSNQQFVPQDGIHSSIDDQMDKTRDKCKNQSITSKINEREENKQLDIQYIPPFTSKSLPSVVAKFEGKAGCRKVNSAFEFREKIDIIDNRKKCRLPISLPNDRQGVVQDYNNFFNQGGDFIEDKRPNWGMEKLVQASLDIDEEETSSSFSDSSQYYTPLMKKRKISPSNNKSRINQISSPIIKPLTVRMSMMNNTETRTQRFTPNHTTLFVYNNFPNSHEISTNENYSTVNSLFTQSQSINEMEMSAFNDQSKFHFSSLPTTKEDLSDNEYSESITTSTTLIEPMAKKRKISFFEPTDRDEDTYSDDFNSYTSEVSHCRKSNQIDNDDKDCSDSDSTSSLTTISEHINSVEEMEKDEHLTRLKKINQLKMPLKINGLGDTEFIIYYSNSVENSDWTNLKGNEMELSKTITSFKEFVKYLFRPVFAPANVQEAIDSKHNSQGCKNLEHNY